MNATQNTQLSAEQEKAALAAIDQDFTQNPNFLAELDARLTSRAHLTTTGLTPTAPYDPTIRTPKEGVAPTIVNTGHPDSDIFRGFTSLNALVEQWINGLSDNEREIMRQQYYGLLTEKIKNHLQEKTKKYADKTKPLKESANTLFTRIQTISDTIDNNLPVLLGVTSGGASVSPTDILEYQDIVRFLRSVPNSQVLLDGYNQVPPVIILPAAYGFPAFNFNDLNDFNLFKNELLNRLNSAETVLRNAITSSGTIALATPADQAKIDALAKLTDVKNSISTDITNFATSLTTNFTDPAGRNNITFQQLERRESLLTEISDNLNPPATNELMSREARFSNVQVRENVGPPRNYDFFYPQSSPNPDNPFVPGRPFTESDYAEFYNWSLKNSSKLSPEVLEAIEANTEELVNICLNPAVNSFYTTVNTAIAGGLNDPTAIKERSNQLVDAYFASTVPIGTLAPFSVNNDMARCRYAMIALHYKIEGADKLTEAKLRAKVKERVTEDLLSRINLPSFEQQSKLAQANLEAYVNSPSAASRQNYITSTRAAVQSEILKEYADKDLVRNQENREKFVADTVTKILAKRREAITKLTSTERPRWYDNLSQRLGIEPKKLAWAAGLGTAAFGAFAYLNPAILTPAKTFLIGQYKSLSAWWAAKSGIGASLVKVAGTGLSTASGFLFADQAYSFFQKGPFSAGRMRSREDIMGTTDAVGTNIGGLGTVNSRTGTYTYGQVHSALAQQIAQAERDGASFIAEEAEGNALISSPVNEAKYQTSTHLWERERQGLTAIVNASLQNALNDRTVSNDGKANAAITNALNTIYGAGGVENNFLSSLESERSDSTGHMYAKAAVSTAVGVGLGAWFASVV